MPILTGDNKLLASHVMQDVPEGGGGGGGCLTGGTAALGGRGGDGQVVIACW